ncbi:ferroxidase fet3 [Blyttiomyces sp. JEL0837]|nr:ferroxidase fet3 [Blyttiomyces sp. JEL0837]
MLASRLGLFLATFVGLNFIQTASTTSATATASSPSPTPKTVTYRWTVTNTTQRLDGVLRYALGINNKPGHETAIEVNTGDTAVVIVTNGLHVPTSLHWHGMFQNGTVEMDGPVGATQCAIAPNQTYTYKFSTAGQEGTYWWHGHYRAQYIDGLRGPFIIRNPNKQTTPKTSYQDDKTIQLADWYHDQSDNLLAWYLNMDTNPEGNEPVFNSSLINGKGQFNCSYIPKGPGNVDCQQNQSPAVIQVTPNQVTRLRIINLAGFAGYKFSIDNHVMTVIEVDGVSVQPHTVDQITLNIAQRYSVLINATQPKANYWIRSIAFHGAPWTSADDPPGFNETTVAILNYAGVDPSIQPSSTLNANPTPLIDTDLIPIPAITPPTLSSTTDLQFRFEFQFTRLDTDDYQKAYPVLSIIGQNVTGTSYKSPKIPTLISIGANKLSTSQLPNTTNAVNVLKGQTVQITIVNDDGGEHPFHLHGHTFWVMASGVATNSADVPTDFSKLTNPLRRDTVTVPACPYNDDGCLDADDGNGSQFGYVVLRFVADNPGVWLFHWHIAAGLVMTFVEGAAQIQSRGLPASARFLNLTLHSLPSVDAATVTYKWSIDYVDVNFDGINRTSVGVNGKPGHETTIDVNMGDRVIVNVTNNINTATSIHFHGLFQKGSTDMDGAAGTTQCPILPGRSYIYDFTITGQEGTYWWHAHSGVLYADGLRGPFIIRGPTDSKLTYDAEYIVQLSDWYHDQSDALLKWYLSKDTNPDGNEPVFQSGLINGRGQFNCTVLDSAAGTTESVGGGGGRYGTKAVLNKRHSRMSFARMNVSGRKSQSFLWQKSKEKDKLVLKDTSCVWLPPASFSVTSGKVYRLRLINNAAFAGFVFSIDGHRLTVVEVDGVYVVPHTVDTIPINIGQRYSVLVTANQPIQDYWMRAELRVGAPWTSAANPPGLITTVRSLLSYDKKNATAKTTGNRYQYNRTRLVMLQDTNLHPIYPKTPPPLTPTDLNLMADFEFMMRTSDTYQKAYLELRPYGTPRGTPLNPPATIPDVKNGHHHKRQLLFKNETKTIVAGEDNQQDTWGESYVSPTLATLYSLTYEKKSVKDLPPTSNVLPLKKNQVVQIVIVNDDPGEHPFHLHGYTFWVLGSGTAKSLAEVPTKFSDPNPLRRDVVTVPPCPYDDNGCLVAGKDGDGEDQFGYVVIRFVADNPGVFPFHCHIEWHIAAGLVATVVVGAEEIGAWTPSQQLVDTCKAYKAKVGA